MRTFCTGYKITMSSPDDMSQFEALLNKSEFKPTDVVCIICKTEGNGRVNDFSRPLAHRCFRDVLAARTGKSPEAVDQDVAFVMSGGCEGIITPHATIFVRTESKENPSQKRKRLSFATANTRELKPEELGTEVHARLVADAVKQAKAKANISDLQDVHYVQVKCPLLTSERINDAKSRGKKVVTEDTLRSMGFSNGTSALGIALGLGEIDDLDPKSICTNAEIYTTRGGCSSGIELMNCQIFVLGNSTESDSPFVAGHARLDDMIDADGVRKALENAGLKVSGSLDEKTRARVLNVFGKAQVPLDGLLRGRRTTLLTDSDLNTRPARAVLGTLIASVVGDPAIYASAGWGYHQGPTGGGMAAAIVAAD